MKTKLKGLKDKKLNWIARDNSASEDNYENASNEHEILNICMVLLNHVIATRGHTHFKPLVTKVLVIRVSPGFIGALLEKPYFGSCLSYLVPSLFDSLFLLKCSFMINKVFFLSTKMEFDRECSVIMFMVIVCNVQVVNVYLF